MEDEKELTPEEAFLDKVAKRVAQSVDDGLKPINERLGAVEIEVAAGRDHSLPGSEEATHKGERYSMSKIVLGIENGNDFKKYAPMEYEMSCELRRKEYAGQATNDDGGGGILVPSEVLRDILLVNFRNRLLTGELGMTEMFDLTGRPTDLPRIVKDPTAEAVAEGQGTPTTAFEAGRHRLEPHTVQTYMKAPRSFLVNSTPDGETLMNNMMARELAQQYNSYALTGTGGSAQPRGLLNQSGLSSVSWTGVKPSESGAYAKLLEMEGKLADASVLEESDDGLKWLCSPAFIRGLRQMKSENAAAGTESLELMRKVLSASAENLIIGHDYVQTARMISTNLADSDVVIGDFSRMIFAMWGTMTIEASNVAGDALRLRETHFVAHTDIDFSVTHPEAFCSATGLDLTGL